MGGGTPADWANESFALAGREIYARLPQYGRISLPADYAGAGKRRGAMQLQGGLAAGGDAEPDIAIALCFDGLS